MTLHPINYIEAMIMLDLLYRASSISCAIDSREHVVTPYATHKALVKLANILESILIELPASSSVLSVDIDITQQMIANVNNLICDVEFGWEHYDLETLVSNLQLAYDTVITIIAE